MKNTFGQSVSVTLFGESHGAEIGAVIDAVCSMEPERVVYVSCNVATQARDLKLFAERGYTAVKAVAVDQFSRTSHVETVALLLKTECAYE